jgi:hypothetical protein
MTVLSFSHHPIRHLNSVLLSQSNRGAGLVRQDKEESRDKQMDKKSICVQCCVCRRIRNGDSWVRRVLMARVNYSHTYCSECYQQLY